ncbi:hypothetical protein ACH5RR_007965 [Cinchona calisaya]|uniref:Uncharacterized protein n=1 Tax=Cinchona calisaya TaxID=153742 RepID=A0ABD3AAR8_9GENT
MAGIVVVFDFDKTIIDLDSDNWVVDELGFTDLFNQLLPTMPWNSLMDKMMGELHANGKTNEEIEEVLRRVPIHARIIPVIKSAYALGNQHQSRLYIDENGRLRILPYHDFHSSSHGCDRCPPNMCKGMIIERIQASIAKEGQKRFIYLGDGVGDFCPSLKLKEGDYMMPRKNFPVWDLICMNRMHVKAEIHEWTDGEDLERILLQLINSIFTAEESLSQLLSTTDCKFLTVSIHEALLPQALSVPH